MEERIINIDMAKRVRTMGVSPVRPTDGANVKLMSKTGVPLNDCCGCIHEENCVYIAFYGANKMPCEGED